LAGHPCTKLRSVQLREAPEGEEMPDALFIGDGWGNVGGWGFVVHPDKTLITFGSTMEIEAVVDPEGRKIDVSKAGLYLPIEEVQQTSDKVMRIQTLQPDVKNKYIKFNRRHKRLLEQLTQFPMGAHDDGPDALEGARSIAQRGKRFRIVNRAEFGI